MYTIIGGDGREYGPVTASQVRAWMAAGRANLETRVKAAGADTWTTIGEVPELNGTAPSGGVPPIQDAGTPAHAKLDILSCYERSWALVRAHFWALAGIGLAMICLYAGSIALELAGLHYVTPILAGPVVGGINYYMLRLVRGELARLGDLFAGFTRSFLTLALVGIVNSLIASVMVYLPKVNPVAAILVIPGIYLAVAFSFAYVLAIDKGMRVWEALETSRRVVTRQWWRVLLLGLLGIPFMLLGVIALGIGLAVTTPLIIGASLYAYEDLFNRRS